MIIYAGFKQFQYEAKSSKSGQKWIFFNALFLSIFCYNLLANISNDEKKIFIWSSHVFYLDKHFSSLADSKKSAPKFRKIFFLI